MHDVLIIGGGIAGASAAYSLARDHRVAMLEAEAHCGLHTTGRSAAVFAESYGNAPIRALTLASRFFFLARPERFSEVPLLSPRGALFVARSEQSERMRAWADEVNACSATPMEPIDGAEALRLVPALRRDVIADAYLDRASADIDVDALHQGFLRGARAAGAQIVVKARVERLERRGGAWHATTPAGTFSAPVVVNAAGAWADDIAVRAGLRPLGLSPRRRTAFLVQAPPGAEIGGWPAVIDADEAFYFKPSSGMLLMSPADETPSEPCDAQPDDYDIALAVDRIQAVADIPVRRISRSWAGLRSFFPDRTPAVGWSGEADGFFWLAGQGGYGIQTSPAMGRLAAALVAGATLPSDLADAGVDPAILSPDRPALAGNPEAA